MRAAELFALPLSEFTRARDALAKELAAAGKRNDAAEVKALRRPTKVAWAVNQLARWRRDEVEALIAAADRLAEAHRELLAGGEAAEVRKADKTEREILRRLVAAAGQVLSDAGLGATSSALRAIEETLHGAAVGTREDRRALLDGRLEKEVEPPRGFGPGVTPGAAARVVEKKTRARTQTAAEKKRAEAAARRAEAAARRAEAAANERRAAAEKKVSALRRAAERAEAQAQMARDRLEAAERKHRE